MPRHTPKAAPKSRSKDATPDRADPTVAVQIRIPREWLGTPEAPGPLRRAATEDRRHLSEWIRLATEDALGRRA